MRPAVAAVADGVSCNAAAVRATRLVLCAPTLPLRLHNLGRTPSVLNNHTVEAFPLRRIFIWLVCCWLTSSFCRSLSSVCVLSAQSHLLGAEPLVRRPLHAHPSGCGRRYLLAAGGAPQAPEVCVAVIASFFFVFFCRDRGGDGGCHRHRRWDPGCQVFFS